MGEEAVGTARHNTIMEWVRNIVAIRLASTALDNPEALPCGSPGGDHGAPNTAEAGKARSDPAAKNSVEPPPAAPFWLSEATQVPAEEQSSTARRGSAIPPIADALSAGVSAVTNDLASLLNSQGEVIEAKILLSKAIALATEARSPGDLPNGPSHTANQQAALIELRTRATKAAADASSAAARLWAVPDFAPTHPPLGPE